MKRLPIKTIIPGASSWINENPALPAVNVENDHPQKVGMSTSHIDTLSVISSGLFNAVYLANTNATSVIVTVREFVDDGFGGDDGSGDVLWGPVSYDLTGIVTLEEFMLGEADTVSRITLWATLFEDQAAGTVPFVPPPDWTPEPDERVWNYLEYAGSYPPPLDSENARLIIPKSVIALAFSAPELDPPEPVYCGIVWPGKEFVDRNPNNEMAETVEEKSIIEDLNSGAVFITWLPDLYKYSVTVSSDRLTAKTRFDQMIKNVGPNPIPWQILSDGTTLWNIFGRRAVPPANRYRNFKRGESTFEIIEVI